MSQHYVRLVDLTGENPVDSWIVVEIPTQLPVATHFIRHVDLTAFNPVDTWITVEGAAPAGEFSAAEFMEEAENLAQVLQLLEDIQSSAAIHIVGQEE